MGDRDHYRCSRDGRDSKRIPSMTTRQQFLSLSLNGEMPRKKY